MPSRKQRRREQKLRRHEYELVVPGEEGEEVVVKPSELRAERESAKPKPAPAARGRATQQTRGARGRAGRPISPPSWRRAAKRMGWIGPVFFIFLLVTGGKNRPPVALSLLWAIVLTGLFIPVTYWIDRMAYRAYLKRSGKAPPDAPARPKT